MASPRSKPPLRRRPGLSDPRVFWALGILLAAGAFAARFQDFRHVVRPDSILIWDSDTVRRLARLEALRDSETYPVREEKDGFPEGTVSHWTRPMDLILQGLDPLASRFFPQARPFEAGAILAGPVLAAGSLLLLLWGARPLLGGGGALTAGALYTFSYSVFNVSRLGNGDHQNLQDLCFVAFAVLWLLGLEGVRPTLLSALSGLALGLAVWTSAESQILFYLWALAVLAQALFLAERLTRHFFALEALRAGTALAVLLAGNACEQGKAWAVEWDQVSWFQIHPLAVLCLFFALLLLRPRRNLGAVVSAAGIALAAGLAVLWFTPGFRLAVREQLRLFAEANLWAQSVVSEYRSSFSDGTGFSLAAGFRRFTLLLAALPPALAVLGAASRIGAPGRLALIVSTSGAFACAAWEVKLGHFFSIFFPLVLVAAGEEASDRIFRSAGARKGLKLALAGVALAAVLHSLPEERSTTLRGTDEAVRELCGFIASRPRAETEGSVLAPWELGSYVLHYGGSPVVASGYHRNLEGIRDGYRFLLAQPEDEAEVRDLLARRRVRFVVSWFDRMFLRDAPRILGIESVYAEPVAEGIRFTDLATRSLFWRLRGSDPVPGLTLVYESPTMVRVAGEGPRPIFKVYRVKA